VISKEIRPVPPPPGGRTTPCSPHSLTTWTPESRVGQGAAWFGMEVAGGAVLTCARKPSCRRFAGSGGVAFFVTAATWPTASSLGRESRRGCWMRSRHQSGPWCAGGREEGPVARFTCAVAVTAVPLAVPCVRRRRCCSRDGETPSPSETGPPPAQIPRRPPRPTPPSSSGRDVDSDTHKIISAVAGVPSVGDVRTPLTSDGRCWFWATLLKGRPPGP
jgi:hypothetical protein